MPSNARPNRRLRFVLLSAAGLLAVLGTALYVIDSDLVNFFLPMRGLVLGMLVTSAALLGVAAVIGGPPRSVRLPVVVALLAGVVYVREFRAYTELEISFQNAGATLFGTLYLPRGAKPAAAVVIAQGSIRAPRRLYHMWADRLVRRGIAVYSFDKRGTGASGGTYEAENNASVENLTLLASDVAAAVSAIRHHEAMVGVPTGILGLSMGGWLGPLATQQVDSVAFLVLVSGPAVSVGEEGYYSDLTGEEHGDGTVLTARQIDSLVAARKPTGFDPRPILGASTVPMLWLFGAEDLSVPVTKSVAVLDSLITLEQRPYSYRVFPDAAHLGFVMRWPFDLAPGFADAIVDWIRGRAASVTQGPSAAAAMPGTLLTATPATTP